MTHRTCRRSARAGPTASVLFIVALLVATGLATILLHPGPSVGVRSAETQSAGPRGSAEGRTFGPVSTAQALSTLVLFNNTLLPYNFLHAVSGVDPYGLAFDAKNGTVWVTAHGSDAVGVVDPQNVSGIRWIPVGHQPWGVAYDNRTDRIFVADTVVSKLTVINASSYQVVRTVPMPAYPQDLLYVWQSDELWVANYWHHNVTVLDATSFQILAQIPVGANPDALEYVPSLHEVFVANYGNNNLTIVDDPSRTVVGQVSLTASPPEDPMALLYDSANGEMYVSTVPGIGVVDPAARTYSGLITNAVTATALALDPLTGLLYGPEFYSTLVEMIWTSNDTYAGEISLGNAVLSQGFLQAALFVPGLDRIVVSNTNHYASGIANLSEISTATNEPVAFVPLQFFTDGVVYDSARGVLYVYDGGAGLLYEINTSTGHILRSVSIHASDSTDVTNGMAFDPQNEWLYLDYGTYWQQGLVVVNVSTFNVVATVQNNSVGSQIGPAGILYDPTDDRVFVSNYIGSNVTVYQASTHAYLGAIPTGRGPVRFSWDPVRDWVFVVNQGSENVTVFTGSTGAEVGNFITNHCPTGILYDPHSAQVYVQNTCSSKDITVNSVPDFAHVATVGIPGGGPTWGLAYDSVNDSILANCDNYSAGVVYVINGTTHQIVASTNVSYSPSDIVYAPAIDRSFVTGFWNGTVSSIALGGAVSTPLSVGSFHAVPPSIVLGHETNLTVIASGGTGPLTYTYSTLPAGCTNDNLSVLPCIPTAKGSFVIGVNVTDMKDGHASAVTTLDVTPQPAPLDVASFHAVPPSIVLGHETNLTVIASGGTGPLTYTYSTLPVGCTNDNLSVLPCTPTAKGSFVIGVNVTDMKDGHASAVTSLDVTPPQAAPLKIVSFAATPSTVSVGGTTHLVVTVSGGTPPYSYAYTALPTGCTTQNLADLPCIPTQSGSFTVHVAVLDAAEQSANAAAGLTVTAAVTPLKITSFVASPNSTEVNGTTVLTVAATGGTPPYTYIFSALPAGCTSANTSELTCRPTSSGTFSPRVNVTDSASGSASATTNLTVTVPAPSSASSSGSSWFSNVWFWGGIGVVIALALFFFLFFFARRRRNKEEPQPVAPSQGSSGAPPKSGSS